MDGMIGPFWSLDILTIKRLWVSQLDITNMVRAVIVERGRQLTSLLAEDWFVVLSAKAACDLLSRPERARYVAMNLRINQNSVLRVRIRGSRAGALSNKEKL
jgi:hypothetical protein